MTTNLSLSGRIAILGAGREGIAAYEYLSNQEPGLRLEIVTEALSGHKKEQELQAGGVLKVCPFGEADLGGFDVLVRSPGVSPYRECIQNAVRGGARVVSPSSIWFADNPEARTIVITGTKGKSTTASLLVHLLKAAGLKVQLAGNIGTPLLACDEKEIDWWVIELSSYQLADLEARPTVGVLLNLASDHLDWHKTEFRYHQDKLRLADLVPAGSLIANRSDTNLAELFEGRAGMQWFDGDLSDMTAIIMPSSLPGKHNRSNLAACLAVFRLLKLDPAEVVSSLAGFEGLPHRLRRVDVIAGVEFVDDSISTAPLATVAALESFSHKIVVLLIGGFERGIDWAPYIDSIAKHAPAALIALPDNGPRIVRALENAGIKPKLGSAIAENLEEAIEIAWKIAPAESVVLLSPGAPSFPQFKNYEDRGRQFAQFCAQFRDSE